MTKHEQQNGRVKLIGQIENRLRQVFENDVQSFFHLILPLNLDENHKITILKILYTSFKKHWIIEGEEYRFKSDEIDELISEILLAFSELELDNYEQVSEMMLGKAFKYVLYRNSSLVVIETEIRYSEFLSPKINKFRDCLSACETQIILAKAPKGIKQTDYKSQKIREFSTFIQKVKEIILNQLNQEKNTFKYGYGAFCDLIDSLNLQLTSTGYVSMLLLVLEDPEFKSAAIENPKELVNIINSFSAT